MPLISQCFLYILFISVSLIWFSMKPFATCHNIVRCVVLIIFWDLTLSTLVDVCWHFRGTWCLCLPAYAASCPRWLLNVPFYGPSSGRPNYFWQSTSPYSIYLHIYSVSGNHLLHPKPEYSTVICGLSRGRGRKEGTWSLQTRKKYWKQIVSNYNIWNLPGIFYF